MAITLTSSWQEVKRRTVTAPNTGLAVTVVLFARYNPSYRTATETRVEQKCTVIFPVSFTGTWCNNGGHYQGADYQFPLWDSPRWVWEDCGTFNGDGSTTYDNVAEDYWTVKCTQGAASLTLGTRWVYPYYGFTAENTEFTVDVQLPSFGPSGLQGNNVVPGTNSFTADVSITAWNGGSSSSRYLELSAWTIGQTTPRRWEIVHGDSLSQTITVDNDSPWTTTPPLTISPNTTYTLTVYATNGSESTGSQNIGDYTTLPLEPLAVLTDSTTNSATFGYTVPADGGRYSKTLEYSLDGGSTWNTIATITSGNATTGTFTITGLTTGEHTILVRSRTTAGSSSNCVVNWSSAGVHLIASDGTTGEEATRLLVSVDGTATEATRLLVSKDGVATENA